MILQKIEYFEEKNETSFEKSPCVGDKN